MRDDTVFGGFIQCAINYHFSELPTFFFAKNNCDSKEDVLERGFPDFKFVSI